MCLFFMCHPSFCTLRSVETVRTDCIEKVKKSIGKSIRSRERNKSNHINKKSDGFKLGLSRI